MEYINIVWYVTKISFYTWILSFLPRLFLPEWINEKLRSIDYFILDQVNMLPIRLSSLLISLGDILYFIGNFFIILLLMFGLALFTYSIYNALSLEAVNEVSLYNLAKNIINDKTTWAAATTIIATTVAIGHMGKLNLDKRLYFEKKQKEWQDEYSSKHNKK